ncbi:Lck-interacting transmembrane adapter 1 [Collichthys lucidus]|uniref:Lck-interacting transmembrane adapter 1 n=1 Tax=Collichthys lucidus TaxID=240159 RepID=A0A4V6AQL3_COLLU|nr:Lck-interacting transmembrane adapter 1 [Collichthys lucidus]
MESHGANVDDPPYQNLLLLGAIAAASAFVVTILIVLVCVGCQRKSKSKHPPAGEKGTSVNMQGTLRHPKLNSMSKSDTRLHEINRFPCNGNSVSKSRPASMDLLLLHSRRSQTDLRPSHGRQLPQIPTSPQGSGQGGGGEAGGEGGGGAGGGEARDHTYTEVGIRNNPTPTHCLDDGLYESVGVREGDTGPKVPCASPSMSTNTPAMTRAAQSPSAQANGARGGNGNVARGNGRGNGAVNGPMTGRGNASASGVNRSHLSSVNSLAIQDPTVAEYASIRKFRKVEKTNRKESNGADSQSDSQSSVSDSPSAAPPPLHRSQEFPRKPLEPFHLHSFPKEAVFIGNGEQYIWKPPEEDDIITLHPPPLRAENVQGHPSPPTVKEIADTYSIVCKTQKKKPPMENNGSKTLPRSFGGDRNASSRGRGRGVQGQARSQEEPCYEPVGDSSWSTFAMAESDPAYATIDTHRKREQAGTNNSTAGGNATLKKKKQTPQQQAAPAAPQSSGPTALPVRGLPGGENFYETISDVKQGANSSSTTTIFTFNDGMEMYVTGL